jgi:hypothetical protein
MVHWSKLEPGQRDATEDAPITDANLKTALLNHVCFNISDLEQSLAFYKEVLGFSRLFSWK